MTRFMDEAEDELVPLVREHVKEAVAYFVVLMIYADGTVVKEEVDAAVGTIGRGRLFNDNSNDENFELLQRMEQKMTANEIGNTRFYGSILAKSKWKYTAAAIMVDIMLADGDVDLKEHGLLTRLADNAQIGQNELDSITSTIKALRRSWR
jgi:uncharacterized tellurite resistance protein B-like protein